jgi:hypothetical protein
VKPLDHPTHRNPRPVLAQLRRVRRRLPAALLLLASCLVWAGLLQVAHSHADPQQAGHEARAVCGVCVSFDRGLAPPPQPLRLVLAAPAAECPPAPSLAPVVSELVAAPRARGPPLLSA